MNLKQAMLLRHKKYIYNERSGIKLGEYNLVKNPKFITENGRIDGWSYHSPRPELMPGFSSVENDKTRSLEIRSKSDIYSFGCWKGTAKLKVGKWYNASVRVRIKNIAEPSLSVAAHFAGHFLETKDN